jgi:hypothetical protein
VQNVDEIHLLLVGSDSYHADILTAQNTSHLGPYKSPETHIHVYRGGQTCLGYLGAPDMRHIYIHSHLTAHQPRE